MAAKWEAWVKVVCGCLWLVANQKQGPNSNITHKTQAKPMFTARPPCKRGFKLMYSYAKSRLHFQSRQIALQLSFTPCCFVITSLAVLFAVHDRESNNTWSLIRTNPRLKPKLGLVRKTQFSRSFLGNDECNSMSLLVNFKVDIQQKHGLPAWICAPRRQRLSVL